MCGIAGVFNKKEARQSAEKAINTIDYRGKDSTKIIEISETRAIGHCLHSIVGNKITQPLQGKNRKNNKKSYFSANCEIYNWKELAKKYKIKARNDAELILKLIEKKGLLKTVELLDGDYAFAYLEGDVLYLARDIIGVKPLWYSNVNGFAFASEKKALEKIGFLDVSELNPRKILKYRITLDKAEFVQRKFFEITPEIKEKKEKIAKNVLNLLTKSIKKRIPNKRLGILFSGGIDSITLAMLCRKLKKQFICYTAVLDDKSLKIPEDLVYAQKAAKKYRFKLKIVKIKLKDVEKYLKTIVPLIEDSNVVKVGVALTFFTACEQARKDKCRVIFSGLGSEEIFAGYQRHKQSFDINKECLSGLLKLYERDTYRDDVITMYNNLELRVPFLDKDLISYALRIPVQYKIEGEREKIILREAAKLLKIDDEFAERKKKAAQYGSNFDRAIKKLARQRSYKLKSDYLRIFYPQKNLKLAALVSTGKDSWYSAYVMQRQNYEVTCLVTIQSRNKESYMYHTPNVELAEMQARAADLPILVQETEGKKEQELNDLRIVMQKAKKIYGVQGVITGALYSNYQRERIEKICDELGLKIFSPLWHINQETEIKEIIDNGFEAIIVAIAADGLSGKWLGRKIDYAALDELRKLSQKTGMNMAGEGGEYESLVLDTPLFKTKIVVKEAEKMMENSCTGVYLVKKAELVRKF